MLNKIIDLKKFIKAYKERIIKEYKLYFNIYFRNNSNVGCEEFDNEI